MNYTTAQNLNTILALILVGAVIILVTLMEIISRNKTKQKNFSDQLDEVYFKIRKDIQTATSPHFIEYSPDLNDLIELTIEVWRLDKKTKLLGKSLSEEEYTKLHNSVKRLKRFLTKRDFEIIDYTEKKHNDGLNYDVLSVEKDPSIQDPIVKETVEPSILYKGRIVSKAKVILLKK